MADLETTIRETLAEGVARLIAPENPREDSRPRAFRSQPTELSVAERQTSALEAIAKELKRYNDHQSYESSRRISKQI